MNKIQNVSSYLLVFFKFLIISIPTLLILKWAYIILIQSNYASDFMNIFGLLENSISTPEGYINLSTVTWTPLTMLLGFCADCIESLPFMISLFFLQQLFSHYQKGEIFSQKNAFLYKKLGLTYLADACFIHSFSHTLMVLAVTLHNAPGSRYLSISFGNANFSSLFYGILVIIISWVMLEASKIHDEQAFTI